MQINIVDILFILPIIFATLLGFKSGFLKILISTTFLVLSLLLTYLIYPSFGELIAKYVENEIFTTLLAISFAYIMSAIFCGAISKVFKKAAGDINFGFVDKFLGLLTGAVKGAILSVMIFVIIIILASKSYEDAEDMQDLLPNDSSHMPVWIEDSYLYPHIMQFINYSIEKAGWEKLREKKIQEIF